MREFIFDLQRFADVTIATGESYSLDGVTYTAITDAVLDLDSDNKVSGIASGKVTAVVTGMENSPTVTFDGTTPLEFTCAGDDNKLKVTCAGSSVGYTSGNVTYSSSGVTFQSGTVGLSGLIAKIIPYSVNLDIPTAGFSATFDGDNLNLKSPDTVTATLNLPEGLSVLLENLKGILPALLKVSEPTFEKIYDIAQKLLTTETSLKLSGEATYNRATKTLSFAQDSTADINALGYEVNLKAVDGALDGISVYYQKDGEDISAGVKMSAGSGNGKLKLDVLQNGVTLFDDLLKVTNGTLTFDPINAKILMDADTSVSMTVRDIYTATITANNALSTTFSADEQGNIVLTPENFSVKATLQRDGTTIFDGAISIENGSLFFNQEAHSINVTKGTTLTLKQGDNSFSFTATDDAGIKMVADNDGNFTVTPGENDGSLDVTIKRGDTPIFSNNVSVVGEISFNPTTQSLGLADGTKISTKFGDYEVTATADGDAAVSVAMTSAGLSITPVKGDGTLNLKLGRESGSMSANLEVLNGSFTLGENGALTVTKDTELQIDFGGGYIVKFKTTDNAGGSISLGAGGLTFTPTEGDGHLELSVTRGGETRTTSLEMTGSLTYKLDGSISLTKDTVLKNIFEDGNILTITANTDASGSIIFTPDSGLNIKPSTPNALNVAVSNSNGVELVNISSIDGSINYSGGLVTASDGTSAHLLYYHTWESEMRTTGGTASLQFTADSLALTANEGATFVLDYLDGTTLEIQNGSYTDIYPTETGDAVEIVSEGINLRTNDDYPLTLEKAGTYTLNGMNVTTTKDNVLVVLSDYDTIEFAADAGIVFDGQEFSGEGTVTLSDGAITLGNGASLTKTFESGNVVTVTANVDDCGTITVTDNGITVTPSAANAMTVQETFTFGSVYNLTNIEGTFGISDNVLKFADGAVVSGDITVGSNKKAVTFSASNGNASIAVLNAAMNYIADDGVTLSTTVGDDVIRINGGGTVASAVVNGVHQISIDNGINISADTGYNFSLDANGSYTLNGVNVTATADNVQVQLDNYDTIIVDGISYTPLDENVTLNIGDTGATCAGGKVTMQMEGFDIALSEDVTDGSISYDSTTNKFTVKAGTKSYIGEGNFPDQFVAQGDFEISVKDNGDGTFTFTTDDTAALAIERNGNIIMSTTITLDGSIIADPTNNEISLPKDTVITMTPGTGKTLQITALDDAGGSVSLGTDGITFTPTEDDWHLELSVTRDGQTRNASLEMTGSLTYKLDGSVSLEDGTAIDITWEDGANLKLTSAGSTGSIGFGEKGLKITSDDENLTMKLTMPYGYSTEISRLKGSLWYNSGKVILDEGTKLTGTGTLGSNAVDVTLETIDGDGYLDFSTSDGFVYGAGTGKLKVTYALGEKESTFIVNSGSVLFGNDISKIAEGTDLATDLKDFMPALNFITEDAGTYTINGQTITTSAKGLALTATDDYMTFKTSNDVVEYDGMTFAGAGNVSLSSDNVVLGAGVEATGFGEGNSFVLAEAGNVTADARIFELSEIEGTPREIPMIITVTGAQDGFIFSRTLTKESEAYIDDALDDEKFENYTSPYIDKNFTEKFISAGDSSYRIRTDAIGLEEVIGISDGATITGGAILDNEPTLSYFNLVTDTEGSFTIGERTYNVSGDSSIALRARFEENAAPYASMVDSLNGTISGDFTGGAFSINGNSGLKVFNDTEVSIAADEDGFEVFGLDAGASLQVEAAGTYNVDSMTFNANAGDYIIGLGESSAYLSAVNNNTLLSGTELADHISNSGSNVTINAGAGNDSIINYGANNLINGDDDDDFISNTDTGSNVTINGGDGDDKIDNSGTNNLINGGTGDDLIFNRMNESVTINAGAGDDSIYNSSSNSMLDGGDGADFIVNAIQSDANGNVSLTSDNVTINGGDGSDTIVNEYGNAVMINGGNGTDSIKNLGSNSTIDAGDDDDQIENHGASSYVNGGAGNDFISSGGANSTVKGGAGNDSVRIINLIENTNVTVDTGDDDDYVESYRANAAIAGGAGNDTIIINSGEAVTIAGGEGDDYIENKSDNTLFQYNAGDGNDTIAGFNATSTLSISGSEYSTAVSGDDLIVTVGDSKITLIDAASLSSPNIETDTVNPIVTLVEAALKRTAAGYPEMAAVAFHPDENLGDEPTNYSAKEDWNITSTDNLNLHAVHYTPENSNDKWVVLIHGYGHYHNAMYVYAAAYLENGYNVLMIDQRAAGESEGEWLTMGSAESKDVALWTREIARRNSKAKITLHGVSMGSATAMLAAARADATNVTSLVEDCGYTNVLEVFSIINDAYLHQPSEITTAMDIVAGSLTGYYLHEAAPINSISSAKMPTMFITGDADTVVPISMLTSLYEASGADVKETFIVEGAAHANAVVDDSIGYNNAVFRFVAEADGEGWTTTSATDNISLRGTKYDDSITNTGTTVTITTGAGNDTIVNNVDSSVTTASLGNLIDAGEGDDYLYSNHSYNPTLLGGTGDDSIVVSRGHMTYIDGGEGNDTILGQESGDASNDWSMGGYATILGGAGDDYISPGYTNDSSIDGGDGNDTISVSGGERVTVNGGAGDDFLQSNAENVTMTGGAGADTFKGGTNLKTALITDYTEGEDVIAHGRSFADMSINGSIVGSDYVFDLTAVGKKITVKDAADKIIKVVDANGEERLFGKYLTLDDNDPATVTAQDGVATIDATERTKDIEVISNDGNSTIIGGGSNATMIGNDGDDLLTAGTAVNMTMTGGAGADTFQGGANLAECVITDYTEGEDVIAHGRSFADMSINGSIVGSDYVFDLTAVGKKITVKDAADKVIKVVDANGEERLFGKYLTLDDNDPATVTAQDGVATIDPSARTKDIEIIGNDGDNTLISSAGNCTLTGGGGKNTYVRSSRGGTQTIVVTDFKEDSDEVYHGIPFANFSLLNIGGAVGDDYVFEAYGATIKYLDGANKKLKFVDVNGDVAYFGNYLTIRDFDADTVTATDKVKVLDASERTKAAQLTGNSLANTILGGKGNDTLDGGAGADVYVYNSGGGNDLIRGFSADSTLSIAGGKYSSAVSGDDVIISVDSGKITLTGAASLDTVNIDGEKDETRLLVTNSDSVKVKLDDEIEVVDASLRKKPLVISANTMNNIIRGSKALDLIYGGNGDDSINSGLGNDKIWGGKGNDTLLGNAGNDYMRGGYGDDKLYGGSGNDTLAGNQDNDYLNGNEGNDKLYGGSGNDTLRGGKGNDSLWGNSGSDTFVYTKDDGNDIIYGFDNTDMLKITGKFVAAYSADNNVISFNVGDTSDAIVLKDFKATTFNVNGDDYVISGNKLVKK